MADWSLPGLSDTYANFLTYLKNRDFDAISNGYSAITNPSEGMMKYVRASDKWQEYLSTVWTDKVLSLAGGGTGASTAATARTSLGIGTLGIQAASGVAITGGSITGLATFNTAGAITVGAGITAGSGSVGIVDATGKIPAISSTYFASLSGANLTNLNGSNIASGTINYARLGSGGGGSTKFLREDNTYQTVSAMKSITLIDTTIDTTGANPVSGNITISPSLTDYTKAFISLATILGTVGAPSELSFKITSNSNITWTALNNSGSDAAFRIRLYVIEFN